MVRVRSYWIIAVLIIIILGAVLLILRGSEDSWIKDERGVWIKHGNPASIPEEVKEQQEAIECASELYEIEKTTADALLISKCLGVCGDYAVDMVSVPRIEEDNLAENQCEDYLA